MIRKTMTLTMLVGLAVMPLSAFADDSLREGPRYERRSPRTADPAEAPATTVVPQSLRIAVKSNSSATANSNTSNSHAASATRPPVRGPLQRAADLAGRWAAEERVTLHGRREYYRVGFFEGLHAARLDNRIGRHDRLVGEQDGWFDPEARRIGSRDGSRQAEELAFAAAEQQVADQFFDLDRDPVRDPRPQLQPYQGQQYDWEEPTLQSVFYDRRSHASLRLGDRFDLYISDWDRTPWNLYQCPDFNEFYVANWNDSDVAFRIWVEDRHRSVVYRALNQGAERTEFRDTFIRA
ncbi:MAG: hypothetical protein OEV00_12050, partial [Acidobacteriota bacterium]|nr:hypothetical protein [Acidobacteriota bacterium]